MVFPLIIFLELKKQNIVFLLLIMGGITDYLDGYFARKLNQKTKFGSIIDPLSDKIFILIPLLWLCQKNLIPFWSLSILLFREFIISSIRISKNNGLPASIMGKNKTFFFFIALLIFFIPYKSIFLENIGLTFYWIGFLFAIITAADYSRTK